MVYCQNNGYNAETRRDHLPLCHLGHEYVRTVNATCWNGALDTNVCSNCGELEVDEEGNLITYNWTGALLHRDYEVIEIRVPTCWSGGGTHAKCIACGHTQWLYWQNTLGHDFTGAVPQPTGNPLWNIISCQREGCGHSTFVPAGR